MRTSGHRLAYHDRSGQRMDAVLEYYYVRPEYCALPAVYFRPHHPQRRLVIIDIGAGYNGYWGDMTRTWVCGNVKPTPEMREMHQKTYDALFNAAAK